MTPASASAPHGTTGLTAAYGAVDVVRDIDLSIAEGEMVAVLGPSGSGKSTLLRAVAGLHPVRAGAVWVGGRDVTSLPAQHRGVGLVPQDGALFPRLTVAQNIAYGLRGVRGRGVASHPRVRELLDLTDLGGFADRRPHELSGGQQQRVALARALAPSPRLMLLDEPFSALDAQLRSRLRAELTDLLRGQGVSTLLITHDQDEALSLSDRIAVLRDGRLVQVDTPRAVYHRPVDEWTARFVGDANILPAHRDVAGVLTTLLGQLAEPVGLTGAEGLVGFYRPEQLRLTRVAEAPSPTQAHVLDATVSRISTFGAYAVATVVADGTGDVLVVRGADDGVIERGSRVRIQAASPGCAVRGMS